MTPTTHAARRVRSRTALLAPSGMHDDHADAYALALQATASGPTAPSTAIPPADPIDAYTQGFAYR